jgi:hypothetical protein
MRGSDRSAPARVASGALHGAAATAAMSAWLLLARKSGWSGRLPPEKIATTILARLGRRPLGRERHAAAILSHFAYGAGLGGLFGLVPSRHLRGRAAAAGCGTLFGLGVWAANYAGWLPALALMPAPRRDRTGRQVTMVVGHLVFGAVLGLLRAPKS